MNKWTTFVQIWTLTIYTKTLWFGEFGPLDHTSMFHFIWTMDNILSLMAFLNCIRWKLALLQFLFIVRSEYLLLHLIWWNKYCADIVVHIIHKNVVNPIIQFWFQMLRVLIIAFKMNIFFLNQRWGDSHYQLHVQ